MGAVIVAGVGQELRKVIVDALADENVSILEEEPDVGSLLLRSEEMELLVLGESVENPVGMAERLGLRVSTSGERRRNPAVLMVVAPERAEEVDRAIRFSPLLTGDVRFVTSDRDDEVAENVRELARKARRRRRFSTILPRLHEKLAPALAHGQRTPYLDALLDNAPLGVIVLDEDGRAIDLNREAERFLATGFAALGRPVSELLPPPAGRDVERLIDESKHARGRSTSARLAWPSSDRELHVELIAVPFARDGDSGTVLIFRDVTMDVHAERTKYELREQRAVSEALETQSDELRRLNDELHQFAYVASHDLQEPLRKIISFSELLVMESEDELSEQGRFYVERMQDAALRMSELISSLLRFSRTGTEALRLQGVDLNEIIQHIRSDLSLPIEEAEARIEVGALPVVEGDEGQIRQLFQNLVANAVKFRKPGEPARIHISAEENTAKAADGRMLHRITVRDEGIGFDDQFADRIFSPFQRLHSSENYPGTGMGLAICSRIVERHGGRISAHSRPGRGASFTIDLPTASSR